MKVNLDLDEDYSNKVNGGDKPMLLSVDGSVFIFDPLPHAELRAFRDYLDNGQLFELFLDKNFDGGQEFTITAQNGLATIAGFTEIVGRYCHNSQISFSIPIEKNVMKAAIDRYLQKYYNHPTNYYYGSEKLTEDNIAERIVQGLRKYQRELPGEDFHLDVYSDYEMLLEHWMDNDPALEALINSSVLREIERKLQFYRSKQVIDEKLISKYLQKEKVIIPADNEFKSTFQITMTFHSHDEKVHFLSDLNKNSFEKLIKLAAYCNYKIPRRCINRATLLAFLQRSVSIV